MRSDSRLLGQSGIVAVGVVISGLGSIVMLSVAAHGSAVRTFATVATWWIAASLVALPFGVFEAFLARLVVGDLANDRPSTTSVSTITGRALSLAGVVAVVCVAADPVLSDRFFDGHRGMAALLGAYVVVAALQVVQRGYAAGRSWFRVVALQLSLDGVLRALAVTLVVLLWPDHERLLALAMLLGAAGSVAASHLRCPGWLARPRLRNPAVATAPMVALLLGALGPILINNASVPWLSAVGVSPVLIGAFAGALTLSRVPVQLGGAAFGPLLTAISHAVESGALSQLRSLSLRAVTAACAVSAAFVVGFTLLGPWVLGLFVGEGYDLPRWVFLTLGASTGLMLVAVVTQARVAAQEQWTALGACWMLAAVVYVAVLLLPVSVLARAAFSPLAASLTGLVALTSVVLFGSGRVRGHS